MPAVGPYYNIRSSDPPIRLCDGCCSDLKKDPECNKYLFATPAYYRAVEKWLEFGSKEKVKIT